MTAEERRFRARPGLVVSSKGAARFVTHLASGQVWELNETAAFIFEVAGKGASPAMVAAALAREYPEVPVEELERDAKELLEDLLRLGVLEPASGEGPATGEGPQPR